MNIKLSSFFFSKLTRNVSVHFTKSLLIFQCNISVINKNIPYISQGAYWRFSGTFQNYSSNLLIFFITHIFLAAQLEHTPRSCRVPVRYAMREHKKFLFKICSKTKEVSIQNCRKSIYFNIVSRKNCWKWNIS